MKKWVFFIVFTCLTTISSSQNIVFTDVNLKSYLVTQLCVDTNNDGIADADVDSNNDNEIQLSEALAVTNLMLGVFPEPYVVQSVEDLRHFDNVQKLQILYFSNLESFELLNLTNITDLQIGNCASLKRIDISDLPNIVNQRIEDISTLEYLNMQNNAFPSGFFSLFYTENIQYACIDNIPEEYSAIQYHMQAGVSPSVNCELSVASMETANNIELFPNPVDNTLFLSLKNKSVAKVVLVDISGKTIHKYENDTLKMNVSFLAKGMYFVKIYFDNNQYVVKKLIKK